MHPYSEFTGQALLALLSYGLATASPGPSNMAIMHIAMQAGRKPALQFAAGVVLGSLSWGLCAAFGIASLLAAHPTQLARLRVCGGIYLFWLALKALKAACSKTAILLSVGPPVQHGLPLLCKGAAMHLTNPKAIFTWLAISSVALTQQHSTAAALSFIGLCGILACIVFGNYAMLFSTASARLAYAKLRRSLNAGLALMFALAGLKLTDIPF